jgi:hypothetical protein
MFPNIATFYKYKILASIFRPHMPRLQGSRGFWTEEDPRKMMQAQMAQMAQATKAYWDLVRTSKYLFHLISRSMTENSSCFLMNFPTRTPGLLTTRTFKCLSACQYCSVSPTPPVNSSASLNPPRYCVQPHSRPAPLNCVYNTLISTHSSLIYLARILFRLNVR